MYTQKLNHGYDTLLDAINASRKKGYTEEFIVNDRGFESSQGRTYLPEGVKHLTVYRIEGSSADPDNESILYLLEMVDGVKGWISDAYGVYADENLAEKINRVKGNLQS
ncbi:MAG TPA: phosphoribosylpyrophosphate synthetase [Saprospiraceae bacterium]|nr:phosphoribosylpyrophosphate synthetase [Saprospiraceae bacterium]